MTHREQMRELFKRSVRTAVGMGLVDLAVQAVDGTRIAGNAARTRTHDRSSLERLLEKTNAAIADLEAQNTAGEDPPPARLPEELTHAQTLREQVQAALQQLEAGESKQSQVNLTDPDATIQKDRHGYLVGYNAQAMVSALDPKAAGHTGLLITAAANAHPCGMVADYLFVTFPRKREVSGPEVLRGGDDSFRHAFAVSRARFHEAMKWLEEHGVEFEGPVTHPENGPLGESIYFRDGGLNFFELCWRRDEDRQYHSVTLASV